MQLLRTIEILLAAWLILGLHPAEASAARLTAETPSVRLQGDVEQPRRIPIPPPPANLVRDWAGTYCDIGSRLKFDATGDCTFQPLGCARSPEETCGRVRESQGMLIVEGFNRAPMRLIPVVWGQRRYLVRTDRMEKFCLGVNSGWEQRGQGRSIAYVLVESSTAPFEGLPSVPKEFRHLLLSHPIEARVVELLGSGWIRNERAAVKLKLDLGSVDGVRAGMQMKLVERGKFAVLTVESVSEHESVALVALSGSDPQPASIGSRFSSRVW